MKNLESPESTVHSHEAGLLQHRERPANAWEQQILLAVELYERDKGKVKLFDHATKEAVMEYWGNHGYSAEFRDLLKHGGFASHPRFKGDVLCVTLDDVDYFLRHHALPEK